MDSPAVSMIITGRYVTQSSKTGEVGTVRHTYFNCGGPWGPDYFDLNDPKQYSEDLARLRLCKRCRKRQRRHD